ncbi:alpha/beta hydrolase [Paraconexibacter antarcticus]|uniref:Alpha/beta hydrolase n=1 Tax=Paraconexibacter antarcticus TaxID=2949664 RepID=A0ABY5DQ83_9ACTN|nr:alpha/beta hydrolase [Paraconexibacter antarcticus]UTI63625.1 alpha/beta hydrolase [Paraconexibacter antarcticus]
MSTPTASDTTTSIWLDLLGSGAGERFYDVGGVRTRVIEAGSPELPALVLIHGTGGHAETYCRNMGPLSEHFRVLALDLPGHGFTDRPATAPTVADHAAHIVGLLDALGIERAHVSGESLGGMVAAWCGIAHPERFDKVVMNTGTLARPDAAGQAQLDDLEQRTLALRDNGVTREGTRHRMNWLVADPSRMTDEMVEVRMRVYSQPGMLDSVAMIMSWVVGMLRGDHGEEFMAPGVLKRLERPTLVLWTEDNPGQTTELAERVSQDIPDHRFEVLTDCAHWPQFERPDVFNQTHLDFLLGA